MTLLFSTNLQANVVSTGVQNFNPSPDGLDFLTIHSSETLNPGIFNVGLFLNNAINSLPYYKETNQNRTSFKDTLLGLDLNIAMGVTENFTIGLNHPVVLAQTINSDQGQYEFGQTGGTEVRLLGKYRFAGDDRGGWAGIYSINFNRLINNPYIGRNGGLIHNFELAWDTTLNKVGTALGVNVGYRLMDPGSPISSAAVQPLKDQVIASVGISHLLPKYDLKLISEIFGGWPAKKSTNNTNRASSSLEMIAGVKYDWNSHLALHAGGGTELQHGVSSPDWRIYAGLNYAFGPLTGLQSILGTSNPGRFRLKNLKFDFNSDTVSAESEKVLKDLAAKIRSFGDFRELIIEGHTDSVGAEQYNQVLSEKRANAVKNYLRKNGFSAKKIKAVGYGETQPLADNGNFQGREQNRRVEFEVIK